MSVRSQTAEPEQKRTATMPVTAANGELTVVPDASMINDPATRYPVMIDPSWSGRLQGNAWTLVSSKDPDRGFWQGGGYLGHPVEKGAAGTGLTCDAVTADGRCVYPSSVYKVRSYFRMDVSGVKRKVITGASFRVEQRWAWTCNNGGSKANVRVTDAFSEGTNWHNQPRWWDDSWASSSPANRKYGATHGCAGPGDVEFNFIGAVSHAARENWDDLTVVLQVDEGNVNYWKRFNAGSAVLAIDYNSLPDVPDELTVDGKACATGAGRPFVPTTTPTIRGRVSDPDGPDTMNARFEWRRIRPDGSQGPIVGLDRTTFGNNTIADFTMIKPDGLPDGVVEWSDSLVGTGDWDNDGRPDVLIRDTDGFLYMLPTEGQRSRARVEIGVGWSDFTIAGVADWDNDGKLDIIAREDSTGDLWLYPGEAKRAHSSQPRARIGWGWGGFDFAGIADYDRDGKQDVIAREPDGVLWIYPGEGKRQPSTQDRASIGLGWHGFTYAGVADRSGDGKPDVFAYDQDGTMWLYLGSGRRAPYSGDPYRHQIDVGWQGGTARVIPDFNNDGAVDMVGQVSWAWEWFFYPGVVGTGPGPERSTIAGRGITTADYAYRMTASDTQLWGSPSDWCEFSVDTTPPDAPTITSSVYKPTGCPPQGCGSLGIADTFTFSSTSTDVVKYRWGFTDPPSETVPAGTPVRWTPPSDGAKTLYVDAVDRAGLTARTKLQFEVAGAKDNDAQWFTTDNPATDATGNGHDLTLTGLDTARTGRMVGGPGSIGFTGAIANGATTAKVLDTSKAFSVSAWVRRTGDAVNRTVVSQQGSTTSAFRLGYDAAANKWVFALAENDAASAVQKTAVSDAPAAAGVWTHLTGTYDSLDREVRLYVDGALQRTIAVVENGFAANGQLWIGKALRNAASAEAWHGDLAEVRAWNRTITAPETLAMADAVVVSGVGEWKFNENSGSIARDTSLYGRDITLNLVGGVKWGEGVGTTSGLELNGISSSATTNEAVLNTEQSFSVDVWAKLKDTGTPRTVVVHRGPSGEDAFTLKYDGAQWSAEMPNFSANGPKRWQAKGAAVAHKWTHLVVTYDASARTLKLSIGYDDSSYTLNSTVANVIGWNSPGVLLVGRSNAGEFFNGNIDHLRAWQGVLAPSVLPATPRMGSSISGDAHDEIISVNADGTVRAFLNVDGEFPHESQEIGVNWTPDRTWFADIDGDGKSEIVKVEQDSSINAFKNVNGMNGFPYADPTTIGSAPGETKRIRFADIDGDGRDDRVSLDADGRVRVYRNLFGMNERGQSTAFATTPVIVKTTTALPEAIRFADLNGDGKAEFITISPDQTVYAFRNLNGLGYGSYDTSQEIGWDWTPDRTWFADLTGDGKAEIIRVRPDGTVWSWTNHHGLDTYPYESEHQVSTGWHEPFRVFFS